MWIKLLIQTQNAISKNQYIISLFFLEKLFKTITKSVLSKKYFVSVMKIYNDIANLICHKVDNIPDLDNLSLVCKSFNKQVKLLKNELIIFECTFIASNWCPHSKACSDEWEQFTIKFNNKLIGNKCIKVIKIEHDDSSHNDDIEETNRTYGIKLNAYPTFLMNGIIMKPESDRKCSAWAKYLQNHL